jgi:hypothetical protein
MPTDQVDAGSITNELKDIISHLEEEEKMETKALKEQKDAEKKLADALQTLTNNSRWLHACLYFREVDFSGNHSEVHQQVDKIIDKTPGNSAQSLVNKYEQVIKPALEEIEQAMKEIEDADKLSHQVAKDEEETLPELKDIEQVVGKVQHGGEKFEHWANDTGERY